MNGLRKTYFTRWTVGEVAMEMDTLVHCSTGGRNIVDASRRSWVGDANVGGVRKTGKRFHPKPQWNGCLLIHFW